MPSFSSEIEEPGEVATDRGKTTLSNIPLASPKSLKNTFPFYTKIFSGLRSLCMKPF